MDPVEFNKLPSFLVNKKGGVAAYRTAISRAYYSAFLSCCKKINDLGFNLPRDAKAHVEVKKYLNNCGIFQLKTIASQILDLRMDRNKADYDINNTKIENKNKLIVGDENFNSVNLNFALSLTEKITDIFDYPLPFVNYILASNNKELLKTFNIKAEEIQNRIIKLIDKSETIKSINTNSKKFILDNVPSLIYNYDEQDKEGLVELIKLPYFHAIVKDIIEIKFE